MSERSEPVPGNLPEVGDVLYRAHALIYTTELEDHSVSAYFERWTVLRTTPCKMWITTSAFVQPWEALPSRAHENRITLTDAQVMERIRELANLVRVCNRSARVMFAWPTKDEALHSLRARTDWRVYHARRALERALAVETFLKDKSVAEVQLPLLSRRVYSSYTWGGGK